LKRDVSEKIDLLKRRISNSYHLDDDSVLIAASERLRNAEIIISSMKDLLDLESSRTIFGKTALEWKDKAIRWLLVD